MAANQSAQDTLRRKLRCAFPGPEMPTAAEILDTNIPYLSASIEELLRLSVPNGIVTRQAVVDTQILGYAIPKGTDVILNTRCLHRPPPVPEHVRSLTSQAAFERKGHQGLEGESGSNLDVFEPRRWLSKDSAGSESFNAFALPSLQFGGGIRGCFGRVTSNVSCITLDLVATILT
jgi:cytochrome P450